MKKESEKVEYEIGGVWMPASFSDRRMGKERRRGLERRVYGDRRNGDRRTENSEKEK